MKQDEPSSTAMFVAQGLWWVGCHRELRREVPDAMARHNLQLVERAQQALTTAWGRSLHRLRLEFLQLFSVAGFYLHFVLRKRCIESYVRRCLEGGATQLVVIGAGYDTLGLCVAEHFSSVAIFEVDHPATQRRKKELLRADSERPGPSVAEASERLHFVPLDLTQSSLEASLRACSQYDETAPTVFVAEGLSMYLTEPQMRALLDSVRSLGGAGSSLVFTYMQPSSSGRIEFEGSSWWVHQWLRLKGERFLWGVAPEALGGFLAGSQLRLVEQASHQRLRTLLSESNRRSRLAAGENVVLAEVVS